jgi:hypothetical protein
MGYAFPAEQEIMAGRNPDGSYTGAIPKMYVNDARLQLTHEQMVIRGKLVEAGKLQASRAGCNGLSPVIRLLYYSHFTTCLCCRYTRYTIASCLVWRAAFWSWS